MALAVVALTAAAVRKIMKGGSPHLLGLGLAIGYCGASSRVAMFPGKRIRGERDFQARRRSLKAIFRRRTRLTPGNGVVANGQDESWSGELEMIMRSPFSTLALGILVAACSAGQTSPVSSGESAIHTVIKANDMNKDGCLSVEEWERMEKLAEDPIANQASNLDQFRNWIMETFDQIDRDNNKCVSVKEYVRSGRKSRAEKW